MAEEFIDLTNGSEEFEELIGSAQPTPNFETTRAKIEEITTLSNAKPEAGMSQKDIRYLERVCEMWCNSLLYSQE